MELTVKIIIELTKFIHVRRSHVHVTPLASNSIEVQITPAGHSIAFNKTVLQGYVVTATRQPHTAILSRRFALCDPVTLTFDWVRTREGVSLWQVR